MLLCFYYKVYWQQYGVPVTLRKYWDYISYKNILPKEIAEIPIISWMLSFQSLILFHRLWSNPLTYQKYSTWPQLKTSVVEKEKDAQQIWERNKLFLSPYFLNPETTFFLMLFGSI